jgi:hypothetical protein
MIPKIFLQKLAFKNNNLFLAKNRLLKNANIFAENGDHYIDPRGQIFKRRLGRNFGSTLRLLGFYFSRRKGFKKLAVRQVLALKLETFNFA